MLRRLDRKWIILIALCLAIKLFSIFPTLVETYYSNGLYRFTSASQRLLLGWIPFSIGDIVYLLAGIWLVRKTYRFFMRLFRKQLNLTGIGKKLLSALYLSLVIYVIFNLCWGLNYNRVPMMKTLGITPAQYTTTDLRKLTDVIVGRLNSYDSLGIVNRPLLERKSYLFSEAKETYRLAYQTDTLLRYRLPSVKPSLFSYAGNYLGFTGYYNPFSGEAQTNTTVPAFIQPFTTCHEIGHQLGYAKENEANFAGFLSARASANPAFQYSLYFDLLSYSLRELQVRDSMQAKQVRLSLKPRVRADFRALQSFFRRYENPLEPIIRILYGNFLRANEQPQGMKSYNEVVAMIMGYYGRYGKI